MSRQKPIEIINPPNMLKAKIGGPLPALDEKAIARAEAELNKLSSQFGDWIAEEAGNLVAAWSEYEDQDGSDAANATLHRCAHDLKGLAPTYGYPLVGRVCNTLCKLTADDRGDVRAPVSLLRAHVEAVRAMVTGHIKGAEHPVGVQLVSELEAQTVRILSAAA